MTNTTYGLTNYYDAFKSPIANTQSNALTNFMYGATASRIYSQTVAKKLQSTMSSYLTSLSSNINDIKTTAKPLSSKGTESSFNQKAVQSSEAGSVSAAATANADIAAYTINVSKLATSQKNVGSSLNSSSLSGFSEGTNTFKLKVGSSEKTISFNVSSEDTNKSSLESMAKAINSVKAGVTANVLSDSKSGKSYLKVESNKTGTSNTFSMTDITGNSVAASGINSVATEAQNAEYKVDGKAYTSNDNTIYLNNSKIEASLKKAEGKDIKLAVGVDTEAIKSDIKDFVNSYNSLVSFTNTNSSSFGGAEKLNGELGDIIKSRKSSLSNIGINIKDDGTLTVDENKLDSSLKNNLSSVKDTLSGYNGVSEKIISKANDVISSPVKYAKPNNVSSDFKNFYNYMSSANRVLSTQSMYRGMVVDTLL